MGIEQTIVEPTFLEHISKGMWLMFTLGLSTVFLYSWQIKKTSKGLKKYLSLSLPNILFHIVASLMVFLTLHEVGEYLIIKFFPSFNPSGGYYYFLSALTGIFGSLLVAWILEIGKKLFGRKEQ